MPAPAVAAPAPGWRRAVAAGAVLLLTAAACSRDPNGDPPQTPTPIASASPPVADLIATAEFPDDPQAYAELTVAAWAAPDLFRLAELANPPVRGQLLELPGPPNRTWRLIECQQPAPPAEESSPGHTDCEFYNLDGDLLRLTIDHDLLAGPEAASALEYESTSYPTDPLDYVEALITAWRAGNLGRMQVLATPTAVGALRTLPMGAEAGYALAEPSDTFPMVLVTFTGDEPRELLVTVNASLLGQGQAIRAAQPDPA